MPLNNCTKALNPIFLIFRSIKKQEEVYKIDRNNIEFYALLLKEIS